MAYLLLCLDYIVQLCSNKIEFLFFVNVVGLAAVIPSEFPNFSNASKIKYKKPVFVFTGPCGLDTYTLSWGECYVQRILNNGSI